MRKITQEISRMNRWRAWALAFSTCMLLPLQAWAQNSIKSINSVQQAGSEVVRIELAQPLTGVAAWFHGANTATHRD